VNEKKTPDLEAFFGKYSGIVPQSELAEFRSLISREQNSKAERFRRCDVAAYGGSEWSPSKVHELDRDSISILLIEDVDVRWIMALDAEFDLDPHLILSYAGLRVGEGIRPISCPPSLQI
jgi:hypothetical protein